MKNTTFNMGMAQPNNWSNLDLRFWLAGFVEGEGSACVSVKVDKALKYKVRLQPEFIVVQHIAGLHIQEAIQEIFDGKGSINLKSGSTNVYDYKLAGLENLITYVLPFYDQYILPFTGKSEQYQVFKHIVLAQSNGEHSNKAGQIELVKLAYTLNHAKGRDRKRTQEEVLTIINSVDDSK